MHGGLFQRDDVKLDELRAIDRNRQPGEEGTLGFIYWSGYEPFHSQVTSTTGKYCSVTFM